MQAVVAVIEQKESAPEGFTPRGKNIFLSLVARFTVSQEAEITFDEEFFQNWLDEKFQMLVEELHEEFSELSQPEPYDIVPEMKLEKMTPEGHAPGDLWTITSVPVQVLQELVAASMNNLQETWGFKLCGSKQEALELEKELIIAQELMSLMEKLGTLYDDDDEPEVKEDSLAVDAADWLQNQQQNSGDDKEGSSEL